MLSKPQIFLSIQALPHGHDLSEHSLASLFRMAPVIEWNQRRSLWFKNWSLLRLRLPPLRTKHSTASSSVAIVRPTRNEMGSGVVVTTTVVSSGPSSRSRRNSPYESSLNDSMEILV